MNMMADDPYLKFLARGTRKRFEWRSHLIAAVLRHPRVAAAAFEIGELARFGAWCARESAKQSVKAEGFVTREALWEALALPALRDRERVLLAEFGVASGIATRWWLERLVSPRVVYLGFDTFQGMPVDFKGVPKGGLSLGGVPPRLDDDRVSWRIGDVCATVLGVDWKEPYERRLFLFDLDLYRPSLKAWEVVSPSFRDGDLIYFDEAYNEDEFRLIHDEVEGNSNFSILGWTAYSLLCRVNGNRGDTTEAKGIPG